MHSWPGKKTLLAAGVAGVSLLAASGFPSRVGATRSEAQLSLPGDLLLPAATKQADRAHEFRATAEELWPEMLALQDLYETVWDTAIEVVLEVPAEVLILRTVDANGWAGTLTAALLPGTDGHTVVRLRERYQEEEGYHRGSIPALVWITALTAPLTWKRFSRSLR